MIAQPKSYRRERSSPGIYALFYPPSISFVFKCNVLGIGSGQAFGLRRNDDSDEAI